MKEETRKEEEEKRRRGEEEIGKKEGEQSTIRASTRGAGRTYQQSTIENLSTLNTQPSTSVTCDRIVPELKAYQDGQLGWWARQQVRRHVANCANCREEIQAMRDFSRFLQQGEGESLTPQLRARILAAVPDTVPTAAPSLRRRPLARPMLAWGAVASALLICILLSPLFLKNNQADMNQATLATSSASSGAAASGSVKESAAGDTAEAAKSAESRVQMKSVSPAAPAGAPASPAASQTASSAAQAPAMTVGKSAPAILPEDKSTAGENFAPARPNSAPENQKAASLTKSDASAKSLSMEQRNSERDASSFLRVFAPQSPTAPAASKPQSDQSGNEVNAVHKARASGSFAEAAGGKSAPPIAADSIPASPTAVQTENTHTSQKTVQAIIKNAPVRKMDAEDILLVVGDVAQSRASLEKTVKNNGGTIAAAKGMTYRGNTQSALLTLDVPASRLPALLSGLDAIGKREAFKSAPGQGRTQSQTDSDRSVNRSYNAPTNKTAEFKNGQERNAQKQPEVSFKSHARTKAKTPNGISAKSAGEPKTSKEFEIPEATARVIIHLQEKPKR